MDQTHKLKKVYQKAKKDHFFFCKKVLGYSKMEEKPHRGLCGFVARPSKKKLILLPRGAYKSSVVTIGYVMWRLLHNPNLRVLICGETQKNSRAFVKEIKTHYEENQRFNQLFGNWVGDNTWREDEFIVRPRSIIKKEPTIKASSLEKQSIIGFHFDMIIIDDPCSPLNVNTPEQIQKTIDYYRMLLSVLDPGKELIIIGTRYSARDLYGYISDPDGTEIQEFDIYDKPAYNDQRELLFPKVLNWEFLDSQKKSQGSFIFNSQYLNNPVSPDTAFFKIEHIQFYDQLPPGCIYFVTFDPAISKAARSDYSAFIVVAVDYLHHWYVVEAIQEKIDTNQIIEKIFYLNEKYKPETIAMEKFMLEQVLYTNIQDEAMRRKLTINLTQLPQDTRLTKEYRIRALQPRFQNGMVHLKKEHTELTHQILYYPHGVKHDDLLDALKSQLQVTYPSNHVYDTASKPDKYAHLDKVSRNAQKEVVKVYKSVNRKVKQTIRF